MILFKSTIFPLRKNILQKTLQKVNIRRANLHYQKPLPYEYQNGLPPLFTPKALQVLYNEYHINLIQKLNQLSETEFENSSVIDIIEKTAQVPSQAVLFNYASQTFNNDFFLQTLTDNQKRINYRIFTRLTNEFGSVEAFKKEFKSNAMAIFGCGWTWLVETEFQMLRIVNSYNAGTALDTSRSQSVEPNFDSLSAPAISYVKEKEKSLQAPSAAPSVPPPNLLRFTPLLVLSVWEHAYLTDYGVNGRDEYIDRFWNCVDWEKVDQRAIFD